MSRGPLLPRCSLDTRFNRMKARVNERFARDGWANLVGGTLIRRNELLAADVQEAGAEDNARKQQCEAAEGERACQIGRAHV